MSVTASFTIRVVRPDEFDPVTDQTAGSVRRTAIAPGMGFETLLWDELFDVEPGGRTGIRHAPGALITPGIPIGRS